MSPYILSSSSNPCPHLDLTGPFILSLLKDPFDLQASLEDLNRLQSVCQQRGISLQDLTRPFDGDDYAFMSFLIHLFYGPSIAKSDRLTVMSHDSFLTLMESMHQMGFDIHAVDAWGETPLHLAASVMDTELIQKLIELGSPLESKNHKGQTPLHQLAHASSSHFAITTLKALDLFVDHGANLNALNAEGQPPLFEALHQDSYDFSKALVRHGAALDIIDAHGNTALHLKFQNSHFLDFSFLIPQGSGLDWINTKNNRHSTALHFAASHGSLVSVKELISLGADPFAVNLQRRTPRDFAADYNILNPEVVVYLEGVMLALKEQKLMAESLFNLQTHKNNASEPAAKSLLQDALITDQDPSSSSLKAPSHRL